MSDCHCQDCNPNAWWMILCPKCGNKRCPHAAHHLNECTNSNEPGQPMEHEARPQNRLHAFIDKPRMTEDQQREAFEAWNALQFIPFSVEYIDGEYVSARTQEVWEAWQAACQWRDEKP